MQEGDDEAGPDRGQQSDVRPVQFPRSRLPEPTVLARLVQLAGNDFDGKRAVARLAQQKGTNKPRRTWADS
jgi:hypothetical protein